MIRLRLDHGRQLTAEGRTVCLPTRLATVLMALCDRAPAVVRHDTILDVIARASPHGHANDDLSKESVAKAISDLRKRLRPFGADRAIEAVWGEGYRWNLGVAEVETARAPLRLDMPPDLLARIENLAFATDRPAGAICVDLVTRGLAHEEARVWGE